MFTSVSASGEAVIPQEIRDELGIQAGGSIKWISDGHGGAYVIPARDIRELRGILEGRGDPLTIDEMNEAIAEGATERYKRFLSRQ